MHTTGIADHKNKGVLLISKSISPGQIYFGREVPNFS
jgi:hypothetical protein